jgi:hypothetical protein
MLTAVLFTTPKLCNQPRCPSMYEQIKKCGTYTQWSIISQKKNEIMSFSRKWMELETIMLTEKGQVQKDKHHMLLLISRILT